MQFDHWDIVLEGESVRITPFTNEDTDRFFMLKRERRPFFPGEAEEEMEGILDHTDYSEIHAIRLKSSPELIGFIDLLEATDDGEEPFVGISLLKDFQNHGYGSEALKLLLNYIHQECGIPRAYVAIRKTNIKSQKCFAKLGAEYYKCIPSEEDLADLRKARPDVAKSLYEIVRNYYFLELPIN